MIIEHYVVGPVQTNCYFAVNPDSMELMVIDPGESGKKLAAIAAEKGYKPKAILLTHGHFDHANGIESFLAAFPEDDITVYASEAEKEVLDDPNLNLSAPFGMGNIRYKADAFLKDGQVISIAGYDVTVLQTPGHTVGGVCYYIPDEGVLFSGDTLFCGSVGRTDFPGGSLGTLVRSIKDKCLTLPDDTKVYPGHESTTTIGDEKKYNPFI